MAYIYKIQNKINNKIYIGKTVDTIQTRWKQHIIDSTKRDKEKRPLYAAFHKYGIENFFIEQIEECSPEELNEREKYWIEYFSSFKNGYNATFGGDGTQYADYNLIYSLYQEGKKQCEIQALTGYCLDTIRTALRNFGIDSEQIKNRISIENGKPVAQIDIKTNEILKIYPSARAAEREHGNTCHIADVCNGKRKTCKGYKWKYI